MPMYDWVCPKCGTPREELLSLSAYEELKEISCKECDHPLTTDDRVIKGVTTTVIGVSKGNYNSGGY